MVWIYSNWSNMVQNQPKKHTNGSGITRSPGLVAYFYPFLSFYFLDNFSVFSKNLDFWLFLVKQNTVETTLPDGLETSGRRAYRYFWPISRRFWDFVFWMIFSVFKKFWFWGLLGSPYCGFDAIIRIGQEMLCLPYAGFLGSIHNYFERGWELLTTDAYNL